MTKTFGHTHRAMAGALTIAALTASIAAQAAFAADLDATAISNPQSSPAIREIAPNPAPASQVSMGCAMTTACIVGRTGDGWMLDFGGPGLVFEATGE